MKATGEIWPGIVGQRRLDDVNQVLAVGEALDDLGGGFLPAELPEELLDVLDFERAGFKRVLLDQVFH